MIQQGWPLWATQGEQVWAVIGWLGMRPIGMELGTALADPYPRELGDGLTFTTIDPTAPVVGFAS